MSAGFITGGTMANFTALAAARHALFQKLGWDVEEQGLMEAPAITVVTSDESHVSLFASLQMLGLGRGRVVRVPTDEQGRMRPDALRSALRETSVPAIVCAQAGNVNSGAFDPVGEIASSVHDAGGWLHVDGAFGAWARAVPSLSHLTEGMELAELGVVINDRRQVVTQSRLIGVGPEELVGRAERATKDELIVH